MNTSSSTSGFQQRQGFTLVEVLVSSFLTLIVMGMLFAVLMGTINAWEGGTSRLKSSGNARLAMDILKTDLESMVVRQTQYNQEWLVSKPYTDADGLKNTWLMFFAPSLDRDEGQDGDIVALSYRVAYQDPISTSEISKMFGLYKTMINTTNTFNKVLGQSDIISTYWNATPDTSPTDRAGLLAPNVVKFEVSWLVRDLNNPSNPLFRFGPEKEIQLGNQLRIDNIQVTGKIVAADITLTTISDEGMRRYRFLNDPAKLGPIIQEFGRIHTLRVPINY